MNTQHILVFYCKDTIYITHRRIEIILIHHQKCIGMKKRSFPLLLCKEKKSNVSLYVWLQKVQGSLYRIKWIRQALHISDVKRKKNLLSFHHVLDRNQQIRTLKGKECTRAQTLDKIDTLKSFAKKKKRKTTQSIENSCTLFLFLSSGVEIQIIFYTHAREANEYIYAC